MKLSKAFLTVILLRDDKKSRISTYQRREAPDLKLVQEVLCGISSMKKLDSHRFRILPFLFSEITIKLEMEKSLSSGKILSRFCERVCEQNVAKLYCVSGIVWHRIYFHAICKEAHIEIWANTRVIM